MSVAALSAPDPALPPTPPETIDLRGCYDGSWKGLIVDDAFAHPAKFAPGLVRRIYALMLERGWLAPGDLVGDPFGGIAGGGIIAAYAGLRWVGVELEPRFVALAERNIALHRARLGAVGLPVPEIVQGDSRGFAGLVGKAGAVCTSPPYAEVPLTGERNFKRRFQPGRPGAAGNAREGYGGIVTSPPYANSLTPGNADTPDHHQHRQDLASAAGHGRLGGGQLARPQRYGGIVTSPPYADGLGHGGGRAQEAMYAETSVLAQATDQYGASPGQIGELPAGDLGAVVTSPPYIDTKVGGNNASVERERVARKLGDGTIPASEASKYSRHAQDILGDYGSTEGQIGGETYWQAVAAVYAQCRLALRPGGVMAVVVKDYVKAGKVVPLCDGTLALLESLGFEPLARARAHLVKETTHAGIFADVTQKTERKSFFRRLAEKKGSPRIDWEEVLFVRAPGATP